MITHANLVAKYKELPKDDRLHLLGACNQLIPPEFAKWTTNSLPLDVQVVINKEFDALANEGPMCPKSLVLFGPSGSHKTTALHCLQRMYMLYQCITWYGYERTNRVGHKYKFGADEAVWMMLSKRGFYGEKWLLTELKALEKENKPIKSDYPFVAIDDLYSAGEGPNSWHVQLLTEYVIYRRENNLPLFVSIQCNGKAGLDKLIKAKNKVGYEAVNRRLFDPEYSIVKGM